MQEAFAEIHIRDLSDNYDFIASRFGNQAFNSDFRGFIFNDIETRRAHLRQLGQQRWQYNVVAFDMREKDTNSELNRFDAARPARLHRERLSAGFHLERLHRAGELSRESRSRRNALRSQRQSSRDPRRSARCAEHEVNAFYFGWAGDGHIGRWNVSHAFYQVGRPRHFNGLAGQAGGHQRANGRAGSFLRPRLDSLQSLLLLRVAATTKPRTAPRKVSTRSSTIRISPAARSVIRCTKDSILAARRWV